MVTLTKSTGTVTLSGAVEKVVLPAVFGWVWFWNMSDSDMYAGLSENISEGADGVAAIPAGGFRRIQTDGFKSVYLLGTGNVEISAQNYADCPFKAGAKGGEIPDLSAYAKTADVPKIKVDSAVSADTVGGHTVGTDVPENAVFTDTFINENLLINPDFKINQRGVSETFSETGKYFVDRWRLASGAVTVNADGTLMLNGTISQIFENAVGDNVTASVSAGTATYDDSTKTFSITANGEIISWAKLEYGSNATQFFPPDTATELMKCKRFYRTLNRGTLAYSSNSESVVFVETFDMPMRVNPDVKIVSSVVLAYCNGWIDEPNVSDMTIVSSNITNMGLCYLHVAGFNMTVNGTAFAENSSFRAATDNFIEFDAEIY